MDKTTAKKQFLFFRRLPPPSRGEYGGLEKLMFDWFERINYTANDVVVIVTTGWKERFLKEAQTRKLSLHVEELPFDFFHTGIFKRYRDMSGFLKQYNPYGIVFFQGHFEEFGIPELWAASWKAKGNVFMHENMGAFKPPERTSKKYFGFISGFGLWWHYYLFCIKFRTYISKRILTVSQAIKNQYISWWGYPANRILVTYHGVDSKNYFPDLNVRKRIREELKIPEDHKVMISLARLSLVKRQDRAIKAFNFVFQNNKEIHLLLLGGGPLEIEYRNLVSSLPCSKNVHFIGYVNKPEDYLKMSDIFVLSSDNEGLSLALMEAMACGLIAISTDCTGSSEVITDGKTGFIVHKTDESLAQGMQKALSLSQEESHHMSQVARQLIHSQFNIDENSKKIFKLIGINL